MAIIYIPVFWFIASLTFTFLFFIIVVFPPKGTCFSEILPVSIEPQVQYLNHQINAKSAKLQMSTEKISQIKKTISELEIKRERIQSEYKKLLKELKSTLLKTESECKAFCFQIENLTEKKLKMKTEIEQKMSGVSVQMSMPLQKPL